MKTSLPGRGKSPAFADRLLPVPVESGFAMPGFHVWCGSVIRGDDDRYYMFASRWPVGTGYSWVFDSEVVLASADNPVGPYQFDDVVLPKRGTRYWDGLMAHNPTIHRYNDTYLLYYTGTTYPEREVHVAWAAKRIGLATAAALSGSWVRRDAPILEPRPGRWDNQITSNPAPCVLPDGKVILVYKSTRTGHWAQGFDFDLRLGVAVADSFDGPYRHASDEPILTFPKAKNSNAEDAYVWREEGRFHLLCKVFDAGSDLIGEDGAGIHAVSPDGIEWTLAANPRGYSRTIQWADGRTETMSRLERVQLLIENGVPTHAIFAVADAANSPWRNIVVPLSGVDQITT